MLVSEIIKPKFNMSKVLKTKIDTCEIHGETDFTSFYDSEFACKQCKEIASELERVEKERQEFEKEKSECLLIAGISSNAKTFADWHFDENQKERQEKMLSALRRYASNFDKSLPNLLFIGGTGSGKTLLANAIAHSVFDTRFTKHNRMPCYMTTSAKINREVKASWKDYSLPNEDMILNNLASYGLLVIDDLGDNDTSTGEMGQNDRNRLGQILALRYQKKPTIITTNLTQQQAKQFLGDRAWDRFQENLVIIECNWESYRQVSAKVSYL